MGRAVRAELGEFVGELSKEPLGCALEAAEAAHLGGATLKAGSRGGRGAAWCRRI